MKFSFNIREKNPQNITSISFNPNHKHNHYSILFQIDDEWSQQNELLDEVNFLLESASAFTEKISPRISQSTVAAAPKTAKSELNSDTVDSVLIDGIKFEVVSI